MTPEIETLRSEERALAERIRLLHVERRAVLRKMRRAIRAQRAAKSAPK